MNEVNNLYTEIIGKIIILFELVYYYIRCELITSKIMQITGATLMTDFGFKTKRFFRSRINFLVYE